jgi:hypothetical protein
MEDRDITWEIIEIGTNTGARVKANELALKELFFIPPIVRNRGDLVITGIHNIEKIPKDILIRSGGVL